MTHVNNILVKGHIYQRTRSRLKVSFVGFMHTKC